MTEFFFPNSRALLPTFCTNCPHGSHFAQMGSHFAQNATTNANSLLSSHNPFLGYVHAQNTQKPTPNHPFSWPGQNGPQLGNLFESGQNVSRSGQKKLFIEPSKNWPLRLGSQLSLKFLLSLIQGCFAWGGQLLVCPCCVLLQGLLAGCFAHKSMKFKCLKLNTLSINA